MEAILQFLVLGLAAIFVGGIVYLEYTEIRVRIELRKTVGWSLAAVRLLWSIKGLSERGLDYRRRGNRAIAISLAAFVLIVLITQVSTWIAV